MAGISSMHWRTLLFYNTFGGACWATTAVLVGYFLGGSLDLLKRWAGRTSGLLFILLALAPALYVAYRWIKTIPSGFEE